MKTEKFGWSCGYNVIDHNNQYTQCWGRSEKMYDTKEEAARFGLRHKLHPHSVGVWSTKRGYVGLAVGINFNAGKNIPGK